MSLWRSAWPMFGSLQSCSKVSWDIGTQDIKESHEILGDQRWQPPDCSSGRRAGSHTRERREAFLVKRTRLWEKWTRMKGGGQERSVLSCSCRALNQQKELRLLASGECVPVYSVFCPLHQSLRRVSRLAALWCNLNEGTHEWFDIAPIEKWHLGYWQAESQGPSWAGSIGMDQCRPLLVKLVVPV